MADEEPVRAFIEVVKGSRNKFEYNEESGRVEFDRRLFSAVSFPCDYGFIPDTKSEEGDPLDILVCIDEPTFPGCVIPVKVIAMLKMSDENGPDPKVVAVPLNDPAWNTLEEVDDLPGNLRDEIGHFFQIYTDLEHQVVEVEGFGDRDEAMRLIEEGRERHRSGG